MGPQPGVLAPLPPAARFLTFERDGDGAVRPALDRLVDALAGEDVVVGLGASLVAELGGDVAPLHDLAPLVGEGVTVPATPRALWIWLRGVDRGELIHRGMAAQAAVDGALAVTSWTDAFVFGEGRDLTGYLDGTENPVDEAAFDAAIVADGPLAGSSFVSVQRWRHDLRRSEALGEAAMDRVIGRRRSDDVELADGPPSAHVKRTAQEDFSPPAFMVRRSMPWTDGPEAGLVFIAFGRSLYAFEAALRRMVGLDDGVVDALFSVSTPLDGASFWCPPTRDGRLDLSAIGR